MRPGSGPRTRSRTRSASPATRRGLRLEHQRPGARLRDRQHRRGRSTPPRRRRCRRAAPGGRCSSPRRRDRCRPRFAVTCSTSSRLHDDPTRAVYNHVWLIGDATAISVEFQAQVDELAELAQVRSGSGSSALGHRHRARPSTSNDRVRRDDEARRRRHDERARERPERILGRVTVEDIRALSRARDAALRAPDPQPDRAPDRALPDGRPGPDRGRAPDPEADRARRTTPATRAGSGRSGLRAEPPRRRRWRPRPRPSGAPLELIEPGARCEGPVDGRLPRPARRRRRRVDRDDPGPDDDAAGAADLRALLAADPGRARSRA